MSLSTDTGRIEFGRVWRGSVMSDRVVNYIVHCAVHLEERPLLQDYEFIGLLTEGCYDWSLLRL